MKRHFSLRLAAGLTVVSSVTMPAWAVPDILLDDFSAPSVAESTLGVQDSYTTSTGGTFAGLAGQVRDATWFLDANAGSATATIGAGSASVQAAFGTGGTYFIAYGSWAVNPYTPQVQGPALDLDLSGYHHILADFAHSASVGIDLVFYTSQLLDQPGAVYYTSTSADLAPAQGGGAASVDLMFNAPGDNGFDWQHVDGIFVEMQSGGPGIDGSYGLDQLTISAVPEPQSLALALAGLATLAVFSRRRIGARRDA